MKNWKSIVIGIVLIGLGVLVGLHALDIVNFNIFFKGWWSLLIIVPCFIGLIRDDDKTGSVLGILLGVGLLLSAQEDISYKTLSKLVAPIILVVVGIAFIIKSIFNRDVNEKIKSINNTLGKDNKVSAVFAGQDINLVEKEFKGATLTSVFGGIDLDLRKAIFTSDTVINATCVFGGIDILVPENVKVVIKSTSVFGGVDQKRKNDKFDENAYTVYVKASCVFGGMDITDEKK